MKVKFDINYLYIIGTIFIIAIFISLFAVTVSSSGVSVAEVPTITFGPEVSGPPPTITASMLQPINQMMQPTPSMMTEPPQMMQSVPIMITEPPQIIQPSTAGPVIQIQQPMQMVAPSMPVETNRVPVRQNLPTRVNPILTKPSRNTPPSDVILVQNNSNATGRPMNNNQGSGGLTQGLIQ